MARITGEELDFAALERAGWAEPDTAAHYAEIFAAASDFVTAFMRADTPGAPVPRYGQKPPRPEPDTDGAGSRMVLGYDPLRRVC